MQIGKNRRSECGTLCRIRSGTKLIEKDEAVGICPLKDGYGVDHVRGESTETLLNTLLITDISVNLIEYLQTGIVKCRNMKSGLSHQTEQTDCLERYGLTTGVGTGYDQE